MAPSHRLLWRGTLSHSLVPLEGIAFIAHLPPHPSPHPLPAASPNTNPGNVLSSPISLALETLRGRPELPVLGVWQGEVDIEEGIRMHINPAFAFSAAYFTRLFCSSSPSSTSPSRTCLRISIGDSPGNPEELLLVPVPAADSPTKLHILVGRKCDTPIKPKHRLPRPDDPLPRPIRDPKSLARTPLNAAPQSTRGTKRPISMSASLPTFSEEFSSDPFFEPAAKRQRSSTDHAIAPIPERPPASAKRRPSNKTPLEDKENPLAVLRSPAPTEQHVPFGPPPLPPPPTNPPTLEESNKASIKKQILNALTAAGCPRTNLEFNDCFSVINRGVTFALRKHLKTRKVQREEVIRLVGTHVGMYFIPPTPGRKEKRSGAGSQVGVALA